MADSRASEHRNNKRAKQTNQKQNTKRKRKTKHKAKTKTKRKATFCTAVRHLWITQLLPDFKKKKKKLCTCCSLSPFPREKYVSTLNQSNSHTSAVVPTILIAVFGLQGFQQQALSSHEDYSDGRSS